MNGLFILYSALAVFGIGVTMVDLFGVFEHVGQSDSSHDGDSGNTQDNGSGGKGDGIYSDGNDGPCEDVNDDGDHDDLMSATPVHSVTEEQHDSERGSNISSVDSGTRFVTRIIGALRTGVYFSLGAGPTGLFGMLIGVKLVESVAWSAGAGIFIAMLAHRLRAFIRKDLDSSIKVSELIMDEATITVSVMPGAMGKAAVRRYGREIEVFIRAKDPTKAFPKGCMVRIIDFDDECCWVTDY